MRPLGGDLRREGWVAGLDWLGIQGMATFLPGQLLGSEVSRH